MDNSVTIESVTYTKGHRSSAFALIRSRARSVMKESGSVSVADSGSGVGSGIK